MRTPESFQDPFGKEPNDTKNQLLRSRFFVFILLFGVTGFLGLPVLWISPVFSKLEKVVWSVVNILYTCALIWMCVLVCWWAYSKMVEA
jgi:hypothetical protein